MEISNNNSELNDGLIPLNISREQIDHVSQTILKKSVVQKVIGDDLPRYYSFDISDIPLYEVIQDALIYKGVVKERVSLENLHQYIDSGLMAVDEHLINEVTKRFYEDVPGLSEVLSRFRTDYIYSLFPGEDFVWQRTPTIRFHFPHAQGINTDPNKLLHIDSMIGHPVEEINIWLSLTDGSMHRSFNVTSLKDSLDYLSGFSGDIERMNNAILQGEISPTVHAVDIGYGEYMVMDSRCIHWPAYNLSDITGVSIDFHVTRSTDLRALPVLYLGCGHRKAEFRVGDYYAGM